MPYFAEQLNRAMAEKNLSAADLSRLTGIGKNSISGYVKGTNEPKGDYLEKLAAALDVPITFFTVERVTKIPVQQCAKCIGKSVDFVKESLEQGIAPFGFAVQMKTGKWEYHISPKKLAEYI